MIQIITSLFFLAVLGYVAYVIWAEYKKAPAELTKVQKFWLAMRESGTIFWNKFVIILAAVVAQLDNLADLLNMPQLKDYINLALSNPKTVALIMLVISSVTIMVRMRPGSKDPLR